MNRRLKKLSWDGETVKVVYEVARLSDEWDSVTIEAHQTPLPALTAALAALKTHVATICELPDLYVRGLEVRGVSLSYSDVALGDGEVEETRGAVITALRQVRARAPLVLNTPHLRELESADGPTLPEDCVEDLDALEQQAFAYVDGQRWAEQTELFQEASA